MKKKLIALILLAGSSAFAQSRFSVGIGFGAPVVAARPYAPGPGYTWVDGYYDPYGRWINGYWASAGGIVRVCPGLRQPVQLQWRLPARFRP
jgi:hypothetical protein